MYLFYGGCMVNEWKEIENIDKECFACGLDNKAGLQMKFKTNGKMLKSELAVPSHLRGWSDLVHGGVLSTVIDEMMSWSAIYLEKKFILTKNMKVNFLKPVRIETPIVAQGFIKEHLNERQAVMRAEILNEAGEVCVTGEGEFVLFTQEQFAKLGIVDDELLTEMTNSFV